MRQQFWGIGECYSSRTVCPQHIEQRNNWIFISSASVSSSTKLAGAVCNIAATRRQTPTKNTGNGESVYTGPEANRPGTGKTALQDRSDRFSRFGSGGLSEVQSATRPKRTLGKLHAYESAIYEAVNCNCNTSYRIKPYGGPGLILQRHFNELERAPHQVLRWENTPPFPPSGFSSDDEGVPPSLPARTSTGQ